MLAAFINGSRALNVVQLLVEKGATVGTLSWPCGTPLQAAAAGGQSGAVEFLLKNGADAKFQNSKHFDLRGGGYERLV